VRISFHQFFFVMSHRHRRDGIDLQQRDGSGDVPEGQGKSEVITQMSIDDTNKMREQLGLPPLNIQEEPHNRAADEARARQEQRETDDLREDLARRKKARLEKQLEGESLGDQLTKTVGGSAADWIARSRQIQEEKDKEEKLAKEEKKKKKKEVKVKKEEIEEETYTPEHLAGLKVKHNAEEFEEGKHVILTLQDRFIVKEVDGIEKIDDEEDILENVNMVDEQKRKRNEDRKKKKKSGYDVHDERGATVLLAQYEPEKDHVGEMRLGTVAEHTAAIRAKLRADLEEKRAEDGEDEDEDRSKELKTKYDLDYQKNIQSDFMRPDELSTFKKRKRRNEKFENQS